MTGKPVFFLASKKSPFIFSCFDCGIHWISQEFDKNDDVEYIYVGGKFEDNARWHVIPKPF